jgi:hypothetical protein
MQIIVLHPREQRMLRFHLTRLRVALLCWRSARSLPPPLQG